MNNFNQTFPNNMININNNNNNNFNNNLNNNLNNNNNINFNNINSNNNINNTKDKLKTIIFQFENGKKYQTLTCDSKRLKEVFNYVWLQIDTNDNPDFNKLKFMKDVHDITKHFLSNDLVASLNLPTTSIIEVLFLKNVLPDGLDKTFISHEIKNK